MPRALRVCSRPGCPVLTTGGRCGACKAQTRRTTDERRGTAAKRGYGGAHWANARAACLRRDVLCTCVLDGHGHGARCYAAATVADHDPVERKELVRQGVEDPDAVEFLRGKCAPCHNRRTARVTPGGWHA